MSKGTRELNAEERALWKRVASGVRARRAVAAHPDPPAAATPCALVARTAAARQSSPGSIAMSAPLANRGAEKRVRRGKLEIGASLDLHGHTQSSALNALVGFLHRSFRDGHAVVIVVTGIGRDGDGVLRRNLPGWVNSPELRGLVSGFAQAHRRHGGAGAFYVFLRRYRRE